MCKTFRINKAEYSMISYIMLGYFMIELYRAWITFWATKIKLSFIKLKTEECYRGLSWSIFEEEEKIDVGQQILVFFF